MTICDILTKKGRRIFQKEFVQSFFLPLHTKIERSDAIFRFIEHHIHQPVQENGFAYSAGRNKSGTPRAHTLNAFHRINCLVLDKK